MSHWFVRIVGLVWLVLCATTGSAWATDNFPGTTLSGSSGSLAGSNTGMTGQTGEPDIVDGGAANYHSYWYSWTAPASGRFTLSTCNPTAGGAGTTNYDTTLAIFTGAAVNALTQMVSNDDTAGCLINNGSALGSTVTIAAVSGTTYRFRVDGYQASQGNYALYWGLASMTVTVTDTSATEGGDTATFTVRPVAPPAGGSISVAIGTSSQCTFSPTPLTFTNSNWTTAQTVTVTAINDAVAEGTHSCSPASIIATGGGYSTTTATPPTLTVFDNDNPAFTITKTRDIATISAPGTITYTITVDNTGSAVLTSPVLTDALLFNGGAATLTSGPTLSSGDANSDGILQDTETWVYTATRAVTQANIDTGGNFSNTATFDPAELPAATSGAAVTTITQSPSFTNVKSQFSGPSPITAAGQTMTYRLTIANTGNVTLTTPTVVSDTFQLGGVARTLTTAPGYTSGDSDSDGAIDVGETWIYTATYLVPQTDIDGTGSFTNLAQFDTAQTAPLNSNTVTTAVTRTASFTNVKAQSSGPSPITAAGQVIGYSFTIANTGNQTLTTPAVVSDTFQLNGVARTLSTGPSYSSGDSDSDGAIDVGETWVYAATYTVPQSDIDGTGSFTNLMQYDTAQTAPVNSNTVTTAVTRSPSFTVGKAQTSGPSPVTAAGQAIGYTITVANTGNQTLNGLSISDTFQLGGSARTLTSGPSYSSGDTDSDSQVDVGETWLYAASYTVPQTDIDGTGSFTNSATYDTAQTAASTSNTVTTNVTRTASFSILKGQSGGPNPVTAAGQTISYLITITNTGNQSLTGLSMTDALLQAGSPRTLTSGPTYSSGDTNSDGDVDVGEIWLYNATYAVALSDMNNGGTFSNTATFDTAQTAASTSAAVTTPVTQTPLLTIDKTFVITTDNGTPGEADPGDIITYYYDVTNSGNVTITNISVADVHSGSGTPPTPAPASVASLVPAATTQFTATYQVTQIDIDNQ